MTPVTLLALGLLVSAPPTVVEAPAPAPGIAQPPATLPAVGQPTGPVIASTEGAVEMGMMLPPVADGNGFFAPPDPQRDSWPMGRTRLPRKAWWYGARVAYPYQWQIYYPTWDEYERCLCHKPPLGVPASEAEVPQVLGAPAFWKPIDR